MSHDIVHVRPGTAVITRGFDPALSLGSARPAVFRSSTYVFPTPEAAAHAFDVVAGRTALREGETADLIYSRFSHPNAEILEDHLVPLEPGATEAAVFNSGMAAIMTAFFTFARPGSTIVHTSPLYGGTTQLIHQFLEPFGVRAVAIHAGEGDALDAAIREATDLCIVLIETPANPTLVMTDIRRAAASAAARPDKPIVMVDNTFLGPVFQHPIPLGADLCLYSATKYLSGFSDLIAGVALARDGSLIARMRSRRGLFGNILQPDECWMLDGRLPTVALRMNRQSKNAQRIAERVAGHPALEAVLYPTLFRDPEQVQIYQSQCAHPGGIVSLVFRDGRPAAFDFLRNLKLARNAVSLGGVETLACHPRSTTHSGMTAAEVAAAGLSDGLVRLSIGIEDWRDLLADVEAALG